MGAAMARPTKTPTAPSTTAAAAAANAKKSSNLDTADNADFPTTTDPALLEKAARIRATLDRLYPSPAIPLDHRSDFQLLVAVMLSAQTTDRKVNEVTPALFEAAPDARAMASTPVAEVQRIIQPVGLAPTKAKNLVAAASLLLERHGGQVPVGFEALEALPGVGHKTASVVMAQAFG